MIIGSEAVLIAEDYETNWKVYKNGAEFTPQTKVDLGRIPENPLGGGRHEMNFVNCCKNGGTPSSSFEYAGPFNEFVVMGNLAIRLQSLEKTLLWDKENMKVSNIGSDEKIRTSKLFPFPEEIITRKVERAAREWVEQNALEMSEEWIKHEYQNGWKL